MTDISRQPPPVDEGLVVDPALATRQRHPQQPQEMLHAGVDAAAYGSGSMKFEIADPHPSPLPKGEGVGRGSKKLNAIGLKQ